ncbi:MAG: hypothetical protein RSE41_11000, partial [Clostridia bacterium]
MSFVNYGVNKVLYNKDFKEAIFEYISNNDDNITFENKVTLTNLSDTQITVKYVEDINATNTYINISYLNDKNEYKNINNRSSKNIFIDYSQDKVVFKKGDKMTVKIVTNNINNIKVIGDII